LMCHHYVTTFTRSEPLSRLCRPRRRGRSRSLPIVRDRRAHLLSMSIHGEHPTPPPTGEWGLEPLMDVHELAAYLGIPISTVYDWRVHGKGPAAYRFGKHLKFAISDVRAWIAQQREPSSEPGRTDRR